MLPATRFCGSAIALGALLALSMATSASPAPQLGTNLVFNGDAEKGQFNGLIGIPNWTRQGNFEAVHYGASDGFPRATDPGPKNRGVYCFIGGPDNDSSSASQVVDVSTLSPIVAKGRVTFVLAGYLGGYRSKGDYAVLSARFVDNNGQDLKAVKVGPVTARQRKNITGLLPVAIHGLVPAATQNVIVTIKMFRKSGSDNDASADNISLIFKT